MCAPWDTNCLAAETALGATGIFGQLSQMLITTQMFLIDLSASWWVLVPSIKLYPDNVPISPDATPIDAVAHIRALMLPIAAVIAVGGMVWNGLLMVLTRKPAPLVNVLRGLWNTALWSAIGVFGTNLLLHATDQFSAYVLTSALHTASQDSFSTQLNSMVVPVTGVPGGMPDGMVILIATIAVICAFLQAMLMLFRDGSVLILAGSTALAASGSFTNATNGWLPKVLKWQLALIFYKPIASMVYATAIYLQGDGNSTDSRVLLMGIAMMVIALVALPVVLRFFNWTVGAVESSSGGGLGMLATAGGAGLHAASSLRGGGFSAGGHARYLANMFDRSTSPDSGQSGAAAGRGDRPGPGPGAGPGSGPGSGPSHGPGPGPGPGPRSGPSPGFKPPAFVGEAGLGKVVNITSAGHSPGPTGAAPGPGGPPGGGAGPGGGGGSSR